MFEIFAAGRIEVLGKHTDYGGGRSLVCAIDRGFHASVEPISSSLVSLTNLDRQETVEFRLGEINAIPQNHWLNYAVTVGERLAQNFRSRSLRGARIEFRSDLPPAAGLSSSSALMIMVFAALAKVNDLQDFDEYRENINNATDLAEYLACIENGQTFRALSGAAGVGTFGGSQDHAAILNCRSGRFGLFSFAPLKFEKHILNRPEYCFVVASSGVTAEKTGAVREKYNRLSQMVAEIVRRYEPQASLSKIISTIGLDKLREFIRREDFDFPKQDLLNRVEQFYVESFEIIPSVVRFLEVQEFEKIGELVDLSQSNAEKLLGNQTPETIFLQRRARQIGAVVASAFGAGFGGSVYALVKTREAEDFLTEWRKNYFQNFEERRKNADFFITKLHESFYG